MKAARHATVQHRHTIFDLHFKVYVVQQRCIFVKLADLGLQFLVGQVLLRFDLQFVLEFDHAFDSHRNFASQSLLAVRWHGPAECHDVVFGDNINRQSMCCGIRTESIDDILLQRRIFATVGIDFHLIKHRHDASYPLGQPDGDFLGQQM